MRLFVRSEPVCLQTKLSTDECFRTLRPLVAASIAIFCSKNVTGSIGPERGAIKKQIWYGNSFQTVIRFHWRPKGDVTVIECRAGLAKLVAAFHYLWLGFAGFFVALITFILIFQVLATPERFAREMMLIPLGGMSILLVELGMFRLGRFLARNEEEYLIEFLKKPA